MNVVCQKIYSVGQEIKLFQVHNDKIMLIGENRIWIFEKMRFKYQIDLKELEEDGNEIIINYFEANNYIFIFRQNSILILETEELEIFKK